MDERECCNSFSVVTVFGYIMLCGMCKYEGLSGIVIVLVVYIVLVK